MSRAFECAVQDQLAQVKMGIMRSVGAASDDKAGRPTLAAILSCIKVVSAQDYQTLCRQFADETDSVQKAELVEMEKHPLATVTCFVHDRFSMRLVFSR